MNLFAEGGPWLTILFFSVLFLVIFRRPLGWLLKLLARSALGLGFLALWSLLLCTPILLVFAWLIPVLCFRNLEKQSIVERLRAID